MRKLMFVVTLFAIGMLVSCAKKTPPNDAATAAEKQSELAANQEQARLWKEAAERKKGSGLESLPLPDQAVQQRQPATVPDIPVQSKTVGLPQGMQGGIRIISLPDLPGESKSFSKAVQVRSVEGERIELDLGDQRVLSLFARARGGPLRVQAGEQAQLDLRFRDNPFDRQRILALRLSSGDGIISALDSGDKPVTITIQLFDLTATQTGSPEKNQMNVLVRVRGERKELSPGQIVDFPDAGLTVGLVGSKAYVGENTPAAEGRPYALNLVAWPTR